MKLKGYFEAFAFILLIQLVKGNFWIDNLKTIGSEQQRMREVNVAAWKLKKLEQTSFSAFKTFNKYAVEPFSKSTSKTWKY